MFISLLDIFLTVGVKLVNLPPNVPDQLQVMDLVGNAPWKAVIKRERCEEL